MLPWKEMRVQLLVLESTCNKEGKEAQDTYPSRSKKSYIISAPAKGPDTTPLVEKTKEVYRPANTQDCI